MYKKVFLALFVLLAISSVSADNHYDASTDHIEIDNYPTATVTLGEQGGSITVEYTVTKPPDGTNGQGSLELMLLSDNVNLVLGDNIEYRNIEGGRSYEVTFTDLRADLLTTDHCGENSMTMLIDDSSHNDWDDGEYTTDELFQGYDGIDGNLDDGQTATFGRLTVEGGDCEDINQGPNADFDYAQGASNIGAGTKIYLDASSSSDPDGEIDEYRWDIEGKDSITSSSPTGSSIRYTHPDSAKSISLTVEDNDGATATLSKVLEVKETEYETDSAGKYMYWVMNPNDPSNYYYWYLSNVRWGVENLNPEEPGSLILQDFDEDKVYDSNQDETAVYRGQAGQIVGSTTYNDKNTLEPLSSDPKDNPSKKAGDESHSWCSEEGGQDTPCHILEFELQVDDQNNYLGPSATNIPDKLANADDIGEVGYFEEPDQHYNIPGGEIAVGHAPNVFRDKDMNGQRIVAVCKGDQSSNSVPDSDGMVIDMAPKTYNSDGSTDQEPDLYRCDSKWSDENGWRGEGGGIWRSVDECNDGIDNDGDGAVDDSGAYDRPSVESDNDCASTDDNSESVSGSCTPVVTKTSSTEKIKAKYGGVADSDGNCDGSNGNTETFDEWTDSLEGVSTGNVPEPEVITCSEYEITGLSQEDSAYCENDIRSYSTHDDDADDPNSQINFVKYYPTKDYYDEVITENYRLKLPNTYDSVTSHFVDENGFTKARMAIDNSGASGDGIKPANRKGAENIFGSDTTTIHEDNYWLEALGMVDADGNGYTTGSYNDSWVPVNAGAPDNQRVSTEFSGGYAGKCPEGTRWKKAAQEDAYDWECSGEPDWPQAVFLPEIEAGSDTIGMMVMPYNFRDTFANSNENLRNNLNLRSWKTAKANEPDQNVDTDDNLDIMKVSCYPGENAPDYSSATEGTDYFNKTVDIPGTDINNPIGVYGEVDMGGLENQNYSCNWNYTTNDGEVISNVGTVIQLQKQTSDSVDNFQDIKGNYTGEDAKEFYGGEKLEDKAYSAYDLEFIIDKFQTREDLQITS